MRILVWAIQLACLSWDSAALGVEHAPYYNPFRGGGSMLCNARDGYGEPLNVIISGKSSPKVLTDKGITNYARAIGFSEECFDFHLGEPFPANLGDGNGWVNQTFELRQDYGDVTIGTCLESLLGGNHFRVYRQNGTLADSDPFCGGDVHFFGSVSEEEPASEYHDVITNGYNIGRNNMVVSAIGNTSYGGVSYHTQAHNITGLLSPGVKGINHAMPQDGIVTLLTVTIV